MSKKNSLLKEIIVNYTKWYKKIDSKVFDEIYSELGELFEKSGYFYRDRSSFGLLTTEVEIEKIKESLLVLFKEDEDVLSLRAYALLAAYLGVKVVIPVIIDKISNYKNVNDSPKTLICYFESLIVLGLKREHLLSTFNKIISNELCIEIKILYLNYLLEDESPENIEIAYRLLEEHDFEYPEGAIWSILIKLQKYGKDTTKYCPIVLNDNFYENHYKVLWLEELKNPAIVKEIFMDYEDHSLAYALLNRAIEYVANWEFIKPLLNDIKDEFLYISEVNVQISYIILLSKFNIPIDKYFLSDEWGIRYGANLTDIINWADKDYFKILHEEEDSNIKDLIKYKILNNGKLSKIDTLSTMNEELLRRVGLYEDYNIELAIENSESPEQICELIYNKPKQCLSLIENYISNIFTTEFNHLDRLSANISLGYALMSLKPIESIIEEKFINELDFNEAEMYLYYKNLSGLKFKSQIAKDKEKLHLFSSESLRLSHKEFFNLYHYLFNKSIDYEYKDLIINSSVCVLRENPQISMTIFRNVDLTDDHLNYILNSLSMPFDEFSKSLRDLYWGRISVESSTDIFKVYRFSKCFYPGIMTLINNDKLSDNDCVEFIELILQEDVEYTILENCLKKLKDILGAESFNKYLEVNYLISDFFDNREFISYYLKKNNTEEYNKLFCLIHNIRD